MSECREPAERKFEECHEPAERHAIKKIPTDTRDYDRNVDILNKIEFDDEYVQRYIKSKPNLLEELYLKFPNKPWNYSHLSKNKSSTVEMIKIHPEKWLLYEYAMVTVEPTKLVIYVTDHYSDAGIQEAIGYGPRNYPGIFWDKITANMHLPLEFIENNATLPWSPCISSRRDITFSFVLKNIKRLRFDNSLLSENPCITPAIIEKNINFGWDWKFVVLNPNTTEEFIESHIDKFYDTDISQNINITPAFVRAHSAEFAWDIQSLMKNKNFPLEYFENYQWTDHPTEILLNHSIPLESILKKFKNKKITSNIFLREEPIEYILYLLEFFKIGAYELREFYLNLRSDVTKEIVQKYPREGWDKSYLATNSNFGTNYFLEIFGTVPLLDAAVINPAVDGIRAHNGLVKIARDPNFLDWCLANPKKVEEKYNSQFSAFARNIFTNPNITEDFVIRHARHAEVWDQLSRNAFWYAYTPRQIKKFIVHDLATRRFKLSHILSECRVKMANGEVTTLDHDVIFSIMQFVD